MLSTEEKQEIEKHLSTVPTKAAACVGALKAVQGRRGWVSDEGVEEIAEFLEMTPEEVDSVATFYNLVFRREVGRHVILICDSVSCWVMGYENLLEWLREVLGIGPGETTEDGRFTLLPVECLGMCNHAPVLMVDEDLHLDVTPEKLNDLLETYE